MIYSKKELIGFTKNEKLLKNCVKWVLELSRNSKYLGEKMTCKMDKKLRDADIYISWFEDGLD